MKNLIGTLLVAMLAILNVACTESKHSQANQTVRVDTTKMFNDAIANKNSKVALTAIELDAENDGKDIYNCKKSTITTMSKFIDSDDYVVKYESLNAQCVFATMK